MGDGHGKTIEPGRGARRAATIVVVVVLAAIAAHLLLLPPKPANEPDEGDDVTPPAEQPASDGLAKAPPVVTAVQFTAAARPSVERAAANPLDADRAYGYLKAICDLGPRPSGSEGMRRQQELVTKHFESHAAEVSLQAFKARNPLGGKRVPMANVIARWRPDATRRVLLCAHYDTRPLPDRDPNPVARRSGRFLGANDGASGVAVLMELAPLLAEYDGPWGVDVVLFDGEELVYQDRRDPYFLGSRWFAEQYARRRPKDWSYTWAILLDMVGDADLQVYYEKHSFRDKETRPLVRELWATAGRLGVDEFVPREKHEVLDDHLALKRYGRIPAVDIIDFDYPHWHTEADTPRNCSGESLAKVGWVVWEWLRSSAPDAP